MAKYRKKPIEIEAVQWDVSKRTWDILMDLGLKNWEPGEIGADSFYIQTSEGDMLVSKGDYIIKEPFDKERGFYPCKPEVFEQTYDKIEEGE